MRQATKRATLAFACIATWLGPGVAAASHQAGDVEQDEELVQTGLELLRAADSALRNVDAMSFTIHREGSGAQASREPTTEARVVMVRREDATRAGLQDDAATPQWNIAAFGRISEPSGEGEYWPFAFAVDGTHARYADQVKVALVEAPLTSVAALVQDSSAWAALDWLSEWETLVAEPIVDNTPRVAPKRDGTVLIGDDSTHAVYVDLAEFPGTFAFGAWWYLSTRDGLPRRLELVYYDVRDDDNKSVGDGISRVTISDIEMLSGATDIADAVKRAAGVLNETNWLQPGDPPLADLLDLNEPFRLPAPEGFQTIGYEPPVDERALQQQGGVAAAPQVDIPAPDFTLLDPQGNEHTLSDYRGQIVVLDFWATWCGPCLAVMPELQAIHEQYKDQGVVMVGVNAWENGDPHALMAARNWDYLLLLDGDRVASDFQVTGIPTMVVVDQNGMIIQRQVGAGPNVREELASTITVLLGEN